MKSEGDISLKYCSAEWPGFQLGICFCPYYNYTRMKIINELKKHAKRDRAIHSQGYFKTAKGEYGEGDIFMGVANPFVKAVARSNKEASLVDLGKLLNSPLHEARLCALFILVNQYKKASDTDQKKILKFYLKNKKGINNWDLVDSSAPQILGEFCLANELTLPMKKLLRSKRIWDRRMAILATFAFIKRDQLDLTFEYALILMKNKEDIMHKAVGWMLKEAGKRDEKRLLKFIDQHGKNMPRTMLRYAIEKLDQKKRERILKANR